MKTVGIEVDKVLRQHGVTRQQKHEKDEGTGQGQVPGFTKPLIDMRHWNSQRRIPGKTN